MGQSQHLIYWAGRVCRYSYMLIYKIIWVMHAFWVVLAYDLWDVQYHSKVGWQVLKNWSLILNSQSSILERLWVRMEAWVKFQDVQVEYQDPQNSVLFSVFLVFFLVVSKGIKSRLCSSGARSPQATNIWSRATEKEKRSPVRAHRFRLVWKPETKPANV